MKKIILTLIAFMFLGLSFAKAQLVTMYDLVLESRNGSQSTYKVSGQNIFFYTKETGPKMLTIDKQNILLEKTNSNAVNLLKVKNTAITEFSRTTSGRTHFVCVAGDKVVYAFYDEPNPMREYLQKLKEKGF
ncbi:MAG: hypothetical protein EAZ44_05735 [Cytophagia bacterium]|nr:MAG: hypothetical protein EAZ44_05735 [Cytophagia bacterium]TAG42967.1 MAG: hypothetical protein EAZ31_05200 [Cytophagia bacterium]